MSLCKFYIEKGSCRHNENCRFRHVDGICKQFFATGACENAKCTSSHVRNEKNEKRKSRNSRNTECFTPSFEPSDMTVKIACASSTIPSLYPYEYHPRDVVLVNDLFGDMTDVYGNLLEEIKNTGKEDKIWKLWHGDTHYIADDKLNYKEKCPTFMNVIERLRKYFKIDVKATRLNWFSDKNEWKPYHFDAAAVDPEKAKVQNFTVGVSFGDTREASFQHAKTKTTVNFPLTDGTVYCFGSQVNIEWRHGIPPITEDKFDKGRISVIIWGWVDMKDL